MALEHSLRAPPPSPGDIRADLRRVSALGLALGLGLAGLEFALPALRPWPAAGLLLVLAVGWFVRERRLAEWLDDLAVLVATRLGRPPSADEARATGGVRPLLSALTGASHNLLAQKAALGEAAREKDALVREIHHRVRNNLQVLASLVNIQRRTLGGATADSALADMRDRIAAMALIHRALYQSAEMQSVDFAGFLDALIEDQIAAHQGLEPRLQARLEAEPLVIDSDRLPSLALFAVEAISNVRKHALPDGAGTFLVRLRLDEGAVEMLIADHGLGASPDLTRQGAGRRLMAGFARQLHGRFDLFANDEGGVSARLQFPFLAAPLSRGVGVVGT